MNSNTHGTNHDRRARRGVVWRRTAGVLAGLVLAAGASGAAQARPDGPQRLRGLEGRVFLVDVATAAAPETTVLVNCYTFGADGTWTDPVALDESGNMIPFTWEQTRVGASTGYIVSFDGEPADDVVFQTGSIRPGPGGVLELTASTPGTPLGLLVSTGHEVDSCPDGVPAFVGP